MKWRSAVAACVVLASAQPAFAEPALPVVGVADAAAQRALLASDDPRLAANKELVFDMWRTLLDARHVELADRFLAEDYIQHNPLAQTGRAGFVEFFSAEPATEIQPAIRWPVVSIVAEGDLVVISFVRPMKDASGADYTTTWFDMFRIENGRIAEHWDGMTRP